MANLFIYLSSDFFDAGNNLKTAIQNKDCDKGLESMAKSGLRGYLIGFGIASFLPEGVEGKNDLPGLGVVLDVYQHSFRALFGMGYEWGLKPLYQLVRNKIKKD